MKILVCFGTRPEAIKMAPICYELRRQKVHFKVCVTAQHREMLDQVLQFFQISPDYDLDIMSRGQSLNQVSSRIISEMDAIFDIEKPELVLVQGDTTTAAIVSMAAFQKGITVGHVEAGLRTYNKKAPYPEEVNRQIISKIADFHFAPTAKALSHLINEQVEKNKIFLTGNTIVDALNWAQEKIKKIKESEEITNIKSLLIGEKKLILITGHRRENFGKGLQQICEALLELAQQDDVEILYPVHFNPNVSGPVREILGNKNNIHLVPPVSYPTIIWLMKICDFIISDSGGIQEEAPSFHKPVLVTREYTERSEGLDIGFAVLVGTDKENIVHKAKSLLNDPPNFTLKNNPYGDGEAARRIVEIIQSDEFNI